MIQQGHGYNWHGRHVIALETHDASDDWPVKVMYVNKHGWPGQIDYAPVEDLEPRPMAYFHGQIPQ